MCTVVCTRRSDDELNSRLPAWYTKCCQAKYLGLPIFFFFFQSVLRWSVAVSVICRYSSRVVAFLQAVATPKFTGQRSASIARSQVWLGLPVWLTICISPQNVLLAPSGPLREENALLLMFTVVLVTDVLLQLDHVSGITYLPVCETMKSAAHNSEDN